MKKKIMMLLLATAMVITVAGCSSEEVEGAVGALNSVGQNIIEENVDTFEELSDDFKEAIEEGINGGKQDGKDDAGFEEKNSEESSQHSADEKEEFIDKEEVYNIVGKIALEGIKEALGDSSEEVTTE